MAKDLDEVNAKRYRINYDGDTLYVIISHEAKEIFISSVKVQEALYTPVAVNQKHKLAAVYDSLTRMISMAWQENHTKDIIRQLNKASRDKDDLPGLLADLLQKK